LTDKWGSVKDEVQKTNPHTLEELAKKHSPYVFSNIRGRTPRKLTTSSAAVLSGFGQKDNFSAFIVAFVSFY